MKVSKLKKTLKVIFKAGLVPLLKSQPGIGKSSVVKDFAKEFNLKVIDLRLSQLDACDLNGLPKVGETKASYLPMDVFPLEDDVIPDGFKGWILFLDELMNASVEVQQASYRIILDREIGNHKLHPKCFVVAATNREEDGCFVNRMPSALLSRMVHVSVDIDWEGWMRYAVSKSIDARIISFLNFKKDMLVSIPSDSEESDTYPCPRTWEFLSNIIKDIPDKEILNVFYYELIAGTIGKAAATAFVSYLQFFTELPSYEEILAKPRKTKVPNIESTGINYALAGMLINVIDPFKTNKVIDYIERLPPEFISLIVTSLLRKHGHGFVDDDKWDELTQATSTDIFGKDEDE